MNKFEKALVVVLCLIIVGLVGFIVWDEVIKTDKESESISTTNMAQNKLDTNSIEDINTENSDTTSNQTIVEDKYEIANEAIRIALKNQKWLEDNNIYKEINAESEVYKPEIYFIKIADNNGMPVYLVKTNVMDSAHTKIVTYKDGKVYVSKSVAGSDYCDEEVDIEKNIVKATNISAEMVTIYKIQDNELKEIAEFENTDKSNVEYPVKNFQRINIKLTDENIDLFVK